MLWNFSSWDTTLPRNILLLFDGYKNSTVAWATTFFAAIFWIASGVAGHIEFAIVAILFHFLPLAGYYARYGPFGIEIDYTPTKNSEEGRIPDKVSERKNEALLFDGEGRIFANIVISERLEDFAVQFSSPSEVSVELLDVPRDEHTYDRDKNVLKGNNITQHEFSIVLNIIVKNPTTRRREYPLNIIDFRAERKIEKITLIDS